jgi:hypothetical protein
MNPFLTYEQAKISRSMICRLLFVMMLMLFTAQDGFCDDDDDNNFDEISITLNVQRIGSTEVPAIIRGQVVYMPLKEVFDFLKIRNISTGTDSISGFLSDPRSAYVVDKLHNRIECINKKFDIKESDIIKTRTGLYLRSDLFGTVFGLDCVFNFRSLSVNLVSRIELPAIREMQQEEMRKNVIRLKGEKKADTVVKRKFEWFHAGTLDWAITNIKETNRDINTRLNLSLGTILAGGETNVYLNYNNLLPFNINQQYFRWRYVNNDKKMLRQVTAGNLFIQPTSSVYGAINGVQFTNTPTTFRRSFGTYRLSNTTKPDWTVELYVNNVLVNYTRADASGFYSFDVPLVYGNSEVKLKFYGPWGEELTEEKNIGIPFNFLPVKELEYNISAGIINDEDHSRFSRLNLNYGLSNHITIGGGMEYNSSVTSGAGMPFLNSSVRLGSNLMISGEYTYGVKIKGILNYHLPSNLMFEANYIKYEEGQTAIKPGQKSFNNYLSERKAVLSMPIRAKKFSAFTRLSYSQLELTNMNYTTAEFLITAIYCKMNSNFTTTLVYPDPKHPLVYSNLSTSFRLPKGIRMTPQLQYEHTSNSFTLLKCEAEKNLFNRGFLNFTYEKNIAHKSDYIGVGIRYNFSFAQTSASVSQNADNTSYVQSARGSLLFNDHTKKFQVDNQSNIGRGGLVVVPFLDLNTNGRNDENEPRISGLKLRVNGGKIKYNKDSTITVSGLEAYNNYFLEFNRNSFDNIAWHLQKQSYAITVEPNHFKLVEVPVTIAGEVSGMVYIKDKGVQKGIGRILVNVYREGQFVTRLLSEPDGFFTYLGLSPGKYSAAIDTLQLAKLNMTSSSPIFFDISEAKEGDVKGGLQFICESVRNPDCPVDSKGRKKDTDGDGVPDCIDKELITPESCFPVDVNGVGNCQVKGS